MINRETERAEYERKLKMAQFIAEMRFEVRAESLRDAHIKVSKVVRPSLVQAALDAGDVLQMAEKQNNWFSGSGEPSDRPGFYFFTADLRIVSDSPSWEEASKWLLDFLELFRHEDITFMELKPYRGMWD